MAKIPVVVFLDSDLVDQIRAALPDTWFESVEAAVADLVADGITGDHAVWTEAVSWQPGEDEEAPDPADGYAIGHIPREIAALINPIISTTRSEDTLAHCSALCDGLGEMASEDNEEFSLCHGYRFLIGYAVSAALKYEAAFSAVRRERP